MGPKTKRRVITLLRWDTAYKMLLEEGKIQANNENDVYLISPYLPDVKKTRRAKKTK